MNIYLYLFKSNYAGLLRICQLASNDFSTKSILYINIYPLLSFEKKFFQNCPKKNKKALIRKKESNTKSTKRLVKLLRACIEKS